MARSWRRGCVLLLLVMGSAAFGQCELGDGRTALEVAGLGTATFEGFETDRATGSVELYGNVCIEDVAQIWRMRASRVSITGLRSQPPEPKLTAQDALITFEEWQLDAAVAFASTAAVTVAGVRITGAGVTGTAGSVRYDIVREIATMRDVRLQGTVFWATARDGVLQGEALVLTDIVATTCDCLDDPPYTVAAPVAEVDLATGGVALEGGTLRALGLEIPLPERMALTGELAEALQPPLLIQEQSRAAGQLGEGLTVLVPRAYEADGVTLGAGVTGLVGAARPVLSLTAEASVAPQRAQAAPVARADSYAPSPTPVEAAAAGPPAAVVDSASAGVRNLDVSAAVAIPADGFVVDAAVSRPLGSGFTAAAAFHNRVTESDDFLHQGVLTLAHTTTLTAPADFGSVRADTAAFAAVSAQTLSGDPVAGPRLGGRAAVAYTSPPTSAGRVRVGASAGGTWYPEQATHQAVFSVAPSWEATFGPVALAASHTLRVVDGRSPFGTSLDRIGPVHRAAASARVAAVVEATDVAASLTATYDLLPKGDAGTGFTRLGASASAAGPVGPGTLRISGAFEGAGLVSERAEVTPYVEGSARYGWSGHEAGVRVRYDLDTGAIADAELLGRARMAGEDLVVTPFLAVDVAPAFAGAGPEITGHGVEIEWRSCCGTLVVGYEQYRNDFRSTLSFRVDPRPLVPTEGL